MAVKVLFSCHTRLLPDRFQENSPSLMAFDFILKNVLNVESYRGHPCMVDTPVSQIPL